MVIVWVHIVSESSFKKFLQVHLQCTPSQNTFAQILRFNKDEVLILLIFNYYIDEQIAIAKLLKSSFSRSRKHKRNSS